MCVMLPACAPPPPHSPAIPASVSASAALIATAVRNGAAGPMVATTRILLAFNAVVFARQVVVAMVNRGSSAEAGQLCCVAVEGGNSDIVVRLSIELLVSGYTREAAAVAAAFYASARMRWASADPVAQLLSKAIVAAVRAEHAEQVADVTDQLVVGSQNELVLDIMRTMVAEGAWAHCSGPCVHLCVLVGGGRLQGSSGAGDPHRCPL